MYVHCKFSENTHKFFSPKTPVIWQASVWKRGEAVRKQSGANSLHLSNISSQSLSARGHWRDSLGGSVVDNSACPFKAHRFNLGSWKTPQAAEQPSPCATTVDCAL